MLLLFAGFLVSAVPAFGVFYDDTQPEVTARVVRISFLSGDVQIRRVSEDGQPPEWEKAVLNLPLVEGDEIATGPETLVEIQLDSTNHIRLAQNAYVKFTTLRDDGIAISLPQGTMSYRSLSFDKDRSYFEIDAPNTTFSIERAGLYRIDAGDTRNGEITAVAAEDGEAKVYTQTSGFTLRSGKTAVIIIDGKYAGDYETNGISRSFDAFDQWVLDRDAVIAKRLSSAKFDSYYDRDIYGAEDLSEHGEWVYTRKYGYVWKPYANTISRYDNWSPYRYGHWRWLPFYGWTWVNDEPWGWATYHHGRWVWDSGYWVWTPYGQYRWRRSWWQPAIVRIGTWNGGTICWYPLGYNDYYYDYNRYYRRTRNVTIINNNTTVIVNPTPTPVPLPSPSPGTVPTPKPVKTPPFQTSTDTRASSPTKQPDPNIPPGGVVTVRTEDFGKRKLGTTPPLSTAKQIIAAGGSVNNSPPILPTYSEVRTRVKTEILVDTPRIDDRRQSTVKTGASERQTGKSLNTQLQQERIFGNRTPKVAPDVRPQRDVSGGSTRDTGAVTRQPTVKSDDNRNNSPDFNPGRSNPTRNTDRKPPTADPNPPVYNPPVYNPPTRNNEDRKPTRQPPLTPPSEERRPDTKPRRETPQPQPEPRRSEPKPQPQPEPRRVEPKPQPQPKPEPKPEPKREEPRAPVDRKKSDN